MKGNQQIIDQLNLRLIEELTAINQYNNHRSLFAIWEYNSLVSYIDERITDETKHYDMILSRIRFLDGLPVVGKLNIVNTGSDVKQMHIFDRAAELTAIKNYNEDIRLFSSLGDNGSRVMIESILQDEEDHIRDLDAQIIQIAQMTIQNYLSAKM